MTPRVLLVAPPNSYRTAAYIEAARSLGIELLVASEGEHSLVSDIAGGLHINLQNPDALDVLLKAARQQPFQGVVATDDASIALASTVAQALGLSHNPPEAVWLSRCKDLARARLHQAGVPVPAHRILNLNQPVPAQAQDFPLPAVVKPLSLSGSRGVIRVDSIAQLEQACGRIRAILQGERHQRPAEGHCVLLEQFIAGPEVAIEGMLRNGQFHLLAFFDKPDPMEGPYFEETYYVSPSRHAVRAQERAVARVQDACAAYGLREGPVHAELRLVDGDACIMEVAARTIGGYCGRLLNFSTGYSLEALVLSNAMAKPVPLRPLEGAAGVLMIPIPRAGVLRRVEGILAAQRLPGIEEVMISVREGYELVPLPEGSSYLGFVFARGATPADVEVALRSAHAELEVVVAPLLQVSTGLPRA